MAVASDTMNTSNLVGKVVSLRSKPIEGLVAENTVRSGWVPPVPSLRSPALEATLVMQGLDRGRLPSPTTVWTRHRCVGDPCRSVVFRAATSGLGTITTGGVPRLCSHRPQKVLKGDCVLQR